MTDNLRKKGCSNTMCALWSTLFFQVLYLVLNSVSTCIKKNWFKKFPFETTLIKWSVWCRASQHCKDVIQKCLSEKSYGMQHKLEINILQSNSFCSQMLRGILRGIFGIDFADICSNWNSAGYCSRPQSYLFTNVFNFHKIISEFLVHWLIEFIRLFWVHMRVIH